MAKSQWDKERDEHRARMKEKADAELQAKLALVSIQTKRSLGSRPPRKIGFMICDTGVKTGYTNATAKFVLRLDESDGIFIAEHGDLVYISKSRDALKAKMDQVARVTFDLKWTRYLKVNYKVEVPYRDNFSSTTHLCVDEKRGKKPILGLELTWEVVEFSDPIRLPGEDSDRYMTREVEDGRASETQESVHELPAGLVVWTKEREGFLQRVRDTFGAVDKKMVELLNGTPEQVAKRLDGVTGPLLLEAPKGKKS